MNLPEEWAAQNSEVASFRYKVPKSQDQPEEEAYIKLLHVGGSKLEVNALSSLRNDEIYSCEIE